ncbi:cytochrome P450 [Roseomonas marmotae]|uniref:Cytochrome P450 n=1 Tax=Roseomonas marmotae TaxID=2768161 RepID=A0ABS3KHU6_9PROT|nr:cytochrome P450 [Roseomonas marmotae]MBO1077032.1 cytochrome P450 [Roseomonas marmotae]QTI78430.1 cytochrome P450 [Roseomonas marmotae]
MRPIPREPGLDHSLAFLAEGYTFVSRRCDRMGTDLFAARIMLTPVVCMRGAEAARIFYDGDRFTRRGAMPQSVLRLLQDKGSVQSLDGEAHRHRKQMFMDLMSPAAVERIGQLLDHHWRQAVPRWRTMPEIVLLREMAELLTRTACDWAALPVPEEEMPALARELSAMVEQAGSIGPRNWWALRLRQRTERRVGGLVERIRAGELQVPPGSAAAVLARHTGPDGQPLDRGIAAVELINILRPILAVGRFITFAALALHEYPDWRQRLAEDETDLTPFVQEVRRFYPFFPVVGGRVRRSFDWSGHRFAEGDWVLLDLYGTNHDPRLWPDPAQFRPERFRGWAGNPYTLIPQGAGEFMQGHRCPGEWITIALIEQAVRLLAGGMHYTVPPQDLSIRLSRIPAAPESGFVARVMPEPVSAAA